MKNSLTRVRTYQIEAKNKTVTGTGSATLSGASIPVEEMSEPERRLLARVVDAWPNLPGPLRLAILAIIDAAPGKGGNP